MREQEQRKIAFQGVIKSVQPRSNVWRYRLDNRTHSMTGYNLFLIGNADGEEKNFAIAISEKQQEKYKFHTGDEIKGTGWTKKYPEWEYADYYRIGALKDYMEHIVDNDKKYVSTCMESFMYHFFGYWTGIKDKRKWKYDNTIDDPLAIVLPDGEKVYVEKFWSDYVLKQLLKIFVESGCTEFKDNVEFL